MDLEQRSDAMDYEALTKPGMKELHDGTIACVDSVRPIWITNDDPVKGSRFNSSGAPFFSSWSLKGHNSFNSACNIKQHLSDEIANPNIWVRPIEMKTGVWINGEGQHRAIMVNTLHNKWVGVCALGTLEVYNPDGSCLSCAATREPVRRLIRYVGPIVDDWWKGHQVEKV